MKLPKECSAALQDHLRPDLFRALCDPQRLSLLCHLATADEPVTVTDAASCCGVHISGVSRHLAMLRDAGVVSASRDGRQVRYQLRFDSLIGTLRGLADALEQCRPSTSPPTSGEQHHHEAHQHSR